MSTRIAKKPSSNTQSVSVVKSKAAEGQGALTSYGTGRRKGAVARVWVKPGTGKVSINGRIIENYFPRLLHQKVILAPFAALEVAGQYDVNATVKGGGVSGQAGALLHGIARALNDLLPDMHKALREGGFLTRDARVVERKKYGRLKARKKTPYKRR